MKRLPVVGAPNYTVDEDGVIRNKYGKIITLLDTDGYKRVSLSTPNGKKHRYVHRAVLEAFVGPCPDGFETDHINNQRGDNKLTNLRWLSKKANVMKAVSNKETGLNAEKIKEIRALKLEKPDLTQQEIGDIYNVHRTTIGKALNPKDPHWNHVV